MLATFGSIDWIVLTAAGATILWVNWYFFAAERAPALAVTQSSGGLHEVTVVVQGGYTPSTIRVKAGLPVRLLFDRQETSSCSEVVFADFGTRTYLHGRVTAVTITPATPGDIRVHLRNEHAARQAHRRVVPPCTRISHHEHREYPPSRPAAPPPSAEKVLIPVSGMTCATPARVAFSGR